MRQSSRIPALVALLGCLTGTAAAQDADGLPAEARRRLDHLVGTWHFETDYLDTAGNVLRTVSAVDTIRYVLNGQVAEMVSRVPELGLQSRAWWFYRKANGTFNLVSLNPDGELWQLSGGLDRFVITSAARPQKEGGTLLVRFTHYDIEPNAWKALMEYSVDEGKRWRHGYRQRYERR